MLMADQDTLMKYDQIKFISNIATLVVNTLLPTVLHYLNPIGQKNYQ